MEIIPTEVFNPLNASSIFSRIASKSFVLDLYIFNTKKPFTVKIYDVGLNGILSIYK